jgi:hypothetical protein
MSLQLQFLSNTLAVRAALPANFNPNRDVHPQGARLAPGFYVASIIFCAQKEENDAGADANAPRQHVTEKSQQFAARLKWVDRDLVLHIAGDVAQWCLLGKSRQFLLIALDLAGEKQDKIPSIQAVLKKNLYLTGFSVETNRFVASVIAACASALESHPGAKAVLEKTYVDDVAADDNAPAANAAPAADAVPAQGDAPAQGNAPVAANLQDLGYGLGYITAEDAFWRDHSVVKWIFFALSHVGVALSACNLFCDSSSVEEREKALTAEFLYQYNLAFAFHWYLFKGFKYLDDLATAAALNLLKKLDAKSPDAQNTLILEYARHLYKLDKYPKLPFVRSSDPDNLFSDIPQEFLTSAKALFAAPASTFAEPAVSGSKNTPPGKKKSTNNNKSAKAQHSPNAAQLPPVLPLPAGGNIRQRPVSNASTGARPSNSSTEGSFITEANRVAYNDLIRNLSKTQKDQVWSYVKEKRLLPAYQNGVLRTELIQSFIDTLK